MFGFAAQRVDRHQNAKRLLAQIRGDSPEPPPVCAYRFFRQSMVYYAGHPVQYCDDPEQLQQFLEQTPQAYVITLDKYKAEVEGKHPGRVSRTCPRAAFYGHRRDGRFRPSRQERLLPHGKAAANE